MTGHRDTVFFVTCIEVRDTQYKSSRCWGWYNNFADARVAVIENHTDIHECYYQYAVIEEYPEGVCSGICVKEIEWFEWDSDEEQYITCERPAFADGIVSWSIS